jgi:GWxTD domain-containing protein
MNTLGWALLHFLWQGTLLGALLAVILRAGRAWSPQVRYLASCATLIAMALGVPVTWAYLSTSSGPAAPASILMLAGQRVELALAPDWREIVLVWLNAHMAWIVVLWAAGAGALLLRIGGGWLVARRHSRLGVPLDYPLSQLMERLGMTGAIELMRSSAVAAPQVFGWLRPVIVVPAAALARLTPPELEAVLAHELAHIARRDFLVNLVQSCVESLLFYHPAVWWVSAQIKLERERCCDDMAVRMCGDRVEYSRALLKLEETQPTLAMAASGSGLRGRVARLLGRSSNDLAPASAGWPALVLLACLLVASGSWWWARAQEPPVPPVPPSTPAPPAAPAPAATPAPPAPPAPPRESIELFVEEQHQLQEKLAQALEQAKTQLEANRAQIEFDLQKAMEEASRNLDTELNSPEAQKKRQEELTKAMAELQANRAVIQQQAKKAMEELTKAILQQVPSAAAQKARQEVLARVMSQLEALQSEIQHSINERIMQREQERLTEAQARSSEFRAERERRTKYAAEHFGGPETDRGRTYVRYGPPDQIETRAGAGETWTYKNWRQTGGTMTFAFDGAGKLQK